MLLSMEIFRVESIGIDRGREGLPNGITVLWESTVNGKRPKAYSIPSYVQSLIKAYTTDDGVNEGFQLWTGG